MKSDLSVTIILYRGFLFRRDDFMRRKKQVGIIREIDSLGRLVIPKEYRILFKLNKNVEVIATEDGVLVRNPKFKLIEITEDEN